MSVITKKYVWDGTMQTAHSVFRKNKSELVTLDVTYAGKLLQHMIRGCASMNDIREFERIRQERMGFWYREELYPTKADKIKSIQEDHKNGIFVWGGYEYESMADLAYDNGMTKADYESYANMGIISNEDKQIDKYGFPITWNGVNYKSVQKMAEANNTYPAKYGKLLKMGICSDASLAIYENRGKTSRRGMQIKWNGKTYDDKYDAASQLNVSLPTIEYRKSKGYASDEDLVGSRRYGTTVQFMGKTYPTINAAVKRNIHKFNESHIRTSCVRVAPNKKVIA